jgi:hypothetical protein
MTEQTWTEENILASDVWRVEKSIEPMSDEEQLAAWKQAVAVLRDLGKLGETLRNDPLLLALTDAMVRAEEELARAEDHLARPEGAELHPREEERLRGLLRRADTLGYAHTALYNEAWENGELKEQALEIVDKMREEATEHFERYRFEVGIPDLSA